MIPKSANFQKILNNCLIQVFTPLTYRGQTSWKITKSILLCKLTAEFEGYVRNEKLT